MQKTVVTLIDDTDGTEASETITFAVDGRNYTLDLNEENAAKFRAALEPWIGSARKAGAPPAKPKVRGALDRAQAQAIREWAQAQGLHVGDRGRIPATVQKAWEDGHR